MLTSSNHVRFDGEVFREPWTRSSPGGRIQMRFWLQVASNDLARLQEFFLCAIFPSSNEELDLLESQLTTGKRVDIEARAQMIGLPDGLLDERAPGVIFHVEKYNVGGLASAAHPAHRRARPSGKMAAAGDHSLEPDELPLEARATP
jgi:hypothetical protein